MAKVRRLDHMPLAWPVEGGLAAPTAGAGVGVKRCVVVRCYVRVKWQRRRRHDSHGEVRLLHEICKGNLRRFCLAADRAPSLTGLQGILHRCALCARSQHCSIAARSRSRDLARSPVSRALASPGVVRSTAAARCPRSPWPLAKANAAGPSLQPGDCASGFGRHLSVLCKGSGRVVQAKIRITDQVFLARPDWVSSVNL
jgi:hypothetical protein